MDFQKMAALGAQAAAGGIIAVWVGFLYLIRPVPTGGIDHVLWQVAAYSSFLIFGLLALVHLYFGAQLKRGADSIRG
jgi:hypothetical protein